MFFKLYAIALPVFLGIDFVWLAFIAKSYYAKQLGYLMAKTPNLLAAGIFYLLFIAGVIFFVIEPAMEKKSWMYALSAGALFGLVTYATYDLTNLATIKDWPLQVTIVDLIWGTTLSTSVATLTFWIAQKLGI